MLQAIGSNKECHKCSDEYEEPRPEERVTTQVAFIDSPSSDA